MSSDRVLFCLRLVADRVREAKRSVSSFLTDVTSETRSISARSTTINDFSEIKNLDEFLQIFATTIGGGREKGWVR